MFFCNPDPALTNHNRKWSCLRDPAPTAKLLENILTVWVSETYFNQHFPGFLENSWFFFWFIIKWFFFHGYQISVSTGSLMVGLRHLNSNFQTFIDYTVYKKKDQDIKITKDKCVSGKLLWTLSVVLHCSSFLFFLYYFLRELSVQGINHILTPTGKSSLSFYPTSWNLTNIILITLYFLLHLNNCFPYTCHI